MNKKTLSRSPSQSRLNILAITFQILINLSCLSSLGLCFSNSEIPQTKSRNLQVYAKFSESGIFYKIEFPKNDVTGTGDKLQDSPYKALCFLKNCPFKCCVGEIYSLECASEQKCQEFVDSYFVGNVASAVIFPIFFFTVFLVSFYCYLKRSKKCGLSFLLAFGSMIIITIPILLFIIWKYKLFPLCEKIEDVGKER